MGIIKIFFHDLPRVDFHLENAFSKYTISWYWVCSNCNLSLQINDTISLFLTLSHSRRKILILICEVKGSSIHSLIYTVWRGSSFSIFSLDLEKPLSICSILSFGGISSSIRSIIGKSRKLRKFSNANHLFLQATCPF